MELRNKKVLVIGTGIGAVPVFYDENEKVVATDVKGKLPEDKNAEVFIGRLPKEVVEEIVLAVPSPGVPVDVGIVARLKEKGIPVWGELELGYRYAKGRLAAITGTNGKTTTTTLVGQMMKEACPSVYVVGNIGTPYTETALEAGEETVTVAEVSSFQLLHRII